MKNTIINYMRTVKINNGNAEYVPAEINEKGKGVISTWIDEAPANARTLVKLCPVEYMAFDSRIQIDERVNRSKAKLIANFDDSKMTVLTGVFHEEEGLVSIVDGVGRLTATQLIDPEKYKKLEVQILLKAPKDPELRTIFEADIYETQDDNKAKVTPMQKHGARVIRKDSAALTMERLKKEYGVEFANSMKDATINKIPYNTMYRVVNRKTGEAAGRYILDIMKASRTLSKKYGRGRYIITALYNMFAWYKRERVLTSEFLGEYLRPVAPQVLKAEAVAKYPMLGTEAACSLYLEDILVENLGLQQKHTVDEKGKIIEIPVAV